MSPPRAGARAPWARALAAGALALAAAAAGAQAPVLGFVVRAAYPHDPGAFTQGLVYDRGVLYESTGLHGRSSVRRVELETGRVLAETRLPARYFGEGLTLFEGRLIQLTWRSGEGFVYDAATLARTGGFRYDGEGWGLTHDGRELIMSDGTATLRRLDPRTFAVTGRLIVRDRGRPVARLNELELVEGALYANVWRTERIARIDPRTGEVTAWLDLAGLLPAVFRGDRVDVLNGIAWDPDRRRLLVTGKLWPRLFHVEPVGRGASAAPFSAMLAVGPSRPVPEPAR